MHIINPYRYAGGGGGGGVPVVEDFTENVRGITTSVLCTAPSGIAANDLLLLLMVSQPTNNVYTTTPAGWTKLVSYDALACFCVYYKIASGSEGDVTVTTLNTRNIAWYLRVSGVDTTTPINVLGTTYAANSITATTPEVTTDVNNCLIITLATFDGGDGTPFSITDADWTIEAEARTGAAAANSAGCWITKPMPTQGATGDLVVTAAVADDFRTVQFAVAPA